MATVKTLAKGPIVIPAEIRKKYRIEPGTELQIMEYGGTTSAEGILFRSHNPSLVLPFIDLSPGGKGENKRAKNAGDQNPPGFHQGTSSGFLHSAPPNSPCHPQLPSFRK
jgi:AbrB family looped-hinge helix DNA binding protein